MDTSRKSSTSSESLNSLSQPHTVLFIVQVALIFIVVCTSLINLTFEIGNQNLWTVILTSCLGIIMPNPKLKPSSVTRDSVNNGNHVAIETTKV